LEIDDSDGLILEPYTPDERHSVVLVAEGRTEEKFKKLRTMQAADNARLQASTLFKRGHDTCVLQLRSGGRSGVRKKRLGMSALAPPWSNSPSSSRAYEDFPSNMPTFRFGRPYKRRR
jgi:hypothetical protein